MEKSLVEEGTNILKKLSPMNQAYFMTLLRVAEAAENGVRSEMSSQQCSLSNQTDDSIYCVYKY